MRTVNSLFFVGVLFYGILMAGSMLVFGAS